VTDNPYQSPVEIMRTRRSVDFWVVLCTGYLALPALSSVLCLTGLLLGHREPGLIGGMVCGGVIGAPLAAIQMLAVFRKNVMAAYASIAIVSVGTAIMILGVFYNAASSLGMGGDSDFIDNWSEWLITFALLALNVWAVVVMKSYAKTIGRP